MLFIDPPCKNCRIGYDWIIKTVFRNLFLCGIIFWPLIKPDTSQILFYKISHLFIMPTNLFSGWNFPISIQNHGSYSQNFIFFLTYVWVRYASALHTMKLKRFSSNKHKSTLVSYEGNEELWIWPQSLKTGQKRTAKKRTSISAMQMNL